MNTLISTSLCNFQISKFPSTFSALKNGLPYTQFSSKTLKIHANTNEVDTRTGTVEEAREEELETKGASNTSTPSSSTAPAIEKDLKKVVQKTAATFAPRASTATKNPAVPGTALYTVFEVQGYVSMLLAIPSLRARDCSKNEKEALNYLFLLIPLLNVTIPFFWKSFAVVWSADIVVFLGMYAWKFGWLQKTE